VAVGIREAMELRPFDEPDLPESLKQLEQEHWTVLNSLYFRGLPVTEDKAILEALEGHDLINGTELTELGKLAHEHMHRYGGEWDYEKDGHVWMSCAVIATDGNGNDLLLHACGPAIDWHIEQYGNDPTDLGLDGYVDAGIWVWEGTMGAVRCDTPDYGVEWDHEANGDWRAPTEEEWELIKGGECPWDKENLPRWPKAKNHVLKSKDFDSLFKKEEK